MKEKKEQQEVMSKESIEEKFIGFLKDKDFVNTNGFINAYPDKVTAFELLKYGSEFAKEIRQATITECIESAPKINNKLLKEIFPDGVEIYREALSDYQQALKDKLTPNK